MADANQPYHVLLIGEDVKQTEMYTELLGEVVSCKVDVMSRIENSFDWVGQSNYHLVVIDLLAASKLDALGLLEQIKRISPTTSVILVSEKADVEGSGAVWTVRPSSAWTIRRPNSCRFSAPVR
jgi:DNA-binding NtrC family response regulator